MTLGYNRSIKKRRHTMKTEIWQSLTKSTNLIDPIETTHHRVSFCSTSHGYVAGRKWLLEDDTVWIQATNGNWVSEDWGKGNQYARAVRVALNTLQQWASHKVTITRKQGGKYLIQAVTRYTNKVVKEIKLETSQYRYYLLPLLIGDYLAIDFNQL